MSEIRLLSTQQVADRLGTYPRAVSRMVERGELQPAQRVSGRGAFMFHPSTVSALELQRECEDFAIGRRRRRVSDPEQPAAFTESGGSDA